MKDTNRLIFLGLVDERNHLKLEKLLNLLNIGKYPYNILYEDILQMDCSRNFYDIFKIS